MDDRLDIHLPLEDVAAQPRAYRTLRAWFEGRVCQLAGRNVFLLKTWRTTDTSVFSFDVITDETLVALYSALRVTTTHNDASSISSLSSSFLWHWLADPARRTASTFLDAWNGEYRYSTQPIEQREYDLGAIVNFVRLTNVVSAWRLDVAEYLLDWLAHIVQHPLRATGVMPILVGDGSSTAQDDWGTVACALFIGVACIDTRPMLNTFGARSPQFLEAKTFVFLPHSFRAMYDPSHLPIVRATIAETSDLAAPHHNFLCAAQDEKSVPPRICNTQLCFFRIVATKPTSDLDDVRPSLQVSLTTDSAVRTLFWWLKRRDISKFNARAHGQALRAKLKWV